MDLVKIFRGLKWTTTESIIIAILQLSRVIILTKFLNAKDFGLMALLMIIYSLSNKFTDLGVSASVIYKKKINNDVLSSLYWINVLLGLFLFLFLFYSSEFISNYIFNEKELTSLLKIFSPIFIVSGLSVLFLIVTHGVLSMQASSCIPPESVKTNFDFF